MITISLCMIVKNEEQTLPRCLDCIRDLVDEIIIVDTGSTDRTKELAGHYTDRVYDFPWTDDFSAARNAAFEKASMQYCMWLDADDVLEPADRLAFRRLKETLTAETDMVMMRYHTAFDEQGRPSFTYYRERIIRNSAAYRWKGAVHETIAPQGRVQYSDVAITHRKIGPGDPNRNLRIFEGLLARGEALSPREQFYYARELTYHGRDREAAEWLEQFLDAGEGWVENEIEACRNLAGCYERLQEPERAFAALVRSLRFGRPRAELCCEIGRFFLDKNDPQTAVYWYEQALGCEREDTRGGFTVPDCYDYIPFLQLCVCWYRLGDMQRAIAYNERAGQVKPNSGSYRYNRDFFAKAFGTAVP